MAKKLTAVEWLEIAISNKLTSEMGPYFAEAFEQAKELERQYLMQSFTSGKIEGLNEGPLTSEQFYNQTYRGL
jgi:hypothetical protein